MVDLPEPDKPMTQKISPRVTSNEHSAIPTTQPNFSSTSGLPRPSALMAAMASSARLPNIFQTSSSLITGSDKILSPLQRFYNKKGGRHLAISPAFYFFSIIPFGFIVSSDYFNQESTRPEFSLTHTFAYSLASFLSTTRA